MVRYHGTITAAIGILILAALGPATAQVPEKKPSIDRVPPAAPGAPAPAPLPDTVEAYSIVFDDWVAKHKPQTAILVVRRAGKTIFAKGHGIDPAKPVVIASLSKMITGVCLATLVRDGKLSFTTPMRDALAQYFKQYGRPADPRFDNVTVEQLLVHRSGLAGNPDSDPMSKIWRTRAQNGQGHLAAPQPLIAEHLRQPLLREPGAKFAYSNTGYTVLTAVIEEKSGKPYEDYCRAAVFDKLGIKSARLHPNYRHYSGAGGWTINGADYLALLEVFDPKNDFLGEETKSWIDRMQSRWDGVKSDNWYSLGVFTMDTPGRWHVSHSGMLNSRGKTAAGKPTTAIVSSFAYRRPDSTSVFVTMTPAQPRGSPALAELRHDIDRAHQAIMKLR